MKENLPLHAVNSMSGTHYYFSFANNQLEGQLPSNFYAQWNSAGAYTGTFTVANNYLSGTLPASLVNVPALQSFSVSSNYLNGTMPSVTSSLTYLDLTRTDIDFCTSPVSLHAQCLLSLSSCSCQSSYPNCNYYCTGAPPPPPITPPEEPISPPIEPPAEPIITPIEPPIEAPIGAPIVVPAMPPLAPPSSPICPNKTRPSLEFQCVNGIWTANNTYAPTLVIPGGAGKVIVIGNLSSSTITIEGTNSTIDIGGSAINLTHVTIELSPSETQQIQGKQILLPLITTNSSEGGSTINLGSISVSSRSTSGCRKPEAKRATLDGGNTLGAYLTVDSSGCNKWWIALVAVLVSVVIIVVIVIILLTVFYKPFRRWVRPFTNRRAKSAQDQTTK